MTIAEEQKALQTLLARSHNAVAFTGAGISTECGIPDFRSKNSTWTRNPTMPFDEFLASEENQIVAWKRKFAQEDAHGDAKPGRGHRALAQLLATGPVRMIITQNIDGLHEAAGAPREQIVELHGNGTYAVCLVCGVRHEISRVRQKFVADGKAPRCLCGGVVKTATISFGQAMPAAAMERAREATLACDLFLSIGSSLVVYPAAGFPILAKRNGAQLVIINRDPTPLDDIADLVLRGDIGSILQAFAGS